jgi:uncharacterized protein with NAD-binding domain and iron-sulfur cluster
MSLLRLLMFLIWTISCSFAFLPARNAPSKSRAITSGHLQAKKSPKVVVIGGGWAGFSAADALSVVEDGSLVEVELLDASPRGQGGLAGGWRTSKLERPVEAGLHGFWREYRNTIATLERIDGVNIDEILTPYTPSILVSESGRVAVAPVLGSVGEDRLISPSLPNLDWTDPAQVLKYLADLLPPPLDLALLAEFSSESPLTIVDRISGVGLLGAWADFGQEDDESWARYDKISAENLFCASAGVTPSLYRELVSPLLHVLPMTPGYDCSAAAALSCFHAFALQSRGAFDVRWCRGTISERIFNPWARQLQARGNVNIRGSSKVTSFSAKDGGYELVINDNETLKCDAVVFAVGGTALKRLLPSCPPLQQFPVSQKFNKLRGVTCVAVRMFLRPDAITTTGLKGGMYDSTQLPPCVAQAMQASPVVVCGPRVGGIPHLAETGFCIYDLQRLHDEFAVVNQGKDEKEPCAAIEVDFFRADTIADMESDAEVSNLALRAVAAALNVDALDPSLLLDVAVVRARDAVSHFCVDSASASPDVRMTKGIYMCGDWIDRAGHASWSTEKAVVTGRQAADALAKDFGSQSDIEVIPAAPDTPQLSALRQAAKAMRGVLSPLLGQDMLPLSPWVIARKIMPLGRL